MPYGGCSKARWLCALRPGLLPAKRFLGGEAFSVDASLNRDGQTVKRDKINPSRH